MPYTAGPFDSSHWYAQWGGTLPGNEVWSCGLRFASVGGFTPVHDEPMLTAVKNAVQTYHTAANTKVSSRALLTFCKLNVIGTDGHYVGEDTHEFVYTPVGGGGSDTTTPANQVAWAVSLTTGVERGPAHRGRFYLPLPVVMPQSSGLLDTTLCTNLVTQTNTFLAALNAAHASAAVAVFSRKSGAAAHRNVTGCQVGKVLDTQRRRRNKLVETYV